MNANLKSELIEVFKGQVDRSVRANFTRLVEKFGPTMSNVANSREYHVWSETVRKCCDRSNDRTNATYSLSESRLESFAAAVANGMADEVLAKVNAKVGELGNGEVHRVGGADFVITGTKHGLEVRIEQNQIINCSVKGKLFNQYPSRIYVDGKFTPATKFALI